jgi:signal transduction histidine kinase/ActR/RegA family two-component response regulator
MIGATNTISFSRDRVAALLEQLEVMAAGSVDAKLPLSSAGDELDAIAHGINALADELRYTSRRAADAERRATEEHVRAKELAERANEAKSVFLRTASHEIRTPIAAILGIADLLAIGGMTDDDRADLVHRLRSNSRSLLSLVGNVLDLSRLEADKIELSFEPISVLEIARDVVHSLAADARKKRLSLHIESHVDSPIIIETDRLRLRQILVNVIANAVKFTARGGVVVTLCEDCDGDRRRAIVDVTDTGIGLDMAQREHLFTPFGQADPSVAREHGGSGLGLALSSRLAEQLGGSLVLLRSEVGEGSTFRLSLDATVAAAAYADARPKSDGLMDNPARRALDGVRVLLADDNPDLQLAIGRSLRIEGAAVAYASNGNEAIAMARSGTFDVVLMDVLMPHMNGVQASRILRADGCRVPIIAISADASPETRANSIDAGCSAFLCKPFEPGDLIASIRFARRDALEVLAE